MNSLNRRLVIALAVSAALNIFFAGFIAARFAYGSRGKPGPGAAVFAPRDGSFAGEKPGRAGPMRRFFHGHAGKLAPQRRALRQAQQAVGRSLDAEPFEPESLRAALTGLRQVTLDSQKALHEALVEMAIKSTPEERRALSRSRFLRRPSDRPPR